jgi:hypothetical protein
VRHGSCVVGRGSCVVGRAYGVGRRVDNENIFLIKS